MKVKIKTYYGELPSYLTVGKEYIVEGFWGDNEKLPIIVGDDFKRKVLSIGEIPCAELNNGSWEIVE